MYQTQPQPQEKLTASKLFFNSNQADSIIQNEFKKIKEQQKQNQKLQEEQNTFRQSLNQQTYHTSLNEQTPIHLVSNQSTYSNGLNQINSAFKKSQLQEEIVSIQRTIEQEKKDIKRHNSSQKFLKQQMPVFQFQYKAKLSPQNKIKKNLSQKSYLASNSLYSDIQQNGQNVCQNNHSKKNNDHSQNYNQNSIQNSPSNLNYESIINTKIKIQEKYFSSQKPTQNQNNQNSKVSEYVFNEQSQNNFDQINSNQIELIVNWLYNLGLIKDRSNQFIQNLSYLSKNGVFIIDLLNRIKGKNSQNIEGIFRQTKSQTQINQNYQKIFNFLQNQNKFNPRFHYFQQQLINGEPKAFFDLLEDIYYFSKNKTSPHDIRIQNTCNNIQEQVLENNENIIFNNQTQNKSQYQNSNQNSTQHKKSITFNFQNPQTQRQFNSSQRNSKYKFENQTPNKLQKSPQNFPNQLQKQQQQQNPLLNHLNPNPNHNPNLNPNPNPNLTNSYQKQFQKRQNSLQNLKNQSQKVFNSSQQFQNSKTLSQNQNSSLFFSSKQNNLNNSIFNKLTLKPEITDHQQKIVSNFLQKIHLQQNQVRVNLGVFKDPNRNGIFLIQLAEKLNQQISTFFPNPQNLEECKFNIITAFEQLELPQAFDYEQYALGIMSGKPRFLTQTIYHIIENQSLNLNKVNQSYTQSQSQSQFQTDNLQNQSQNISNFQQKSFSKHSLSQMILPQYQQSIRILPYTEQQLENLKQNTINWLQSEFQINYLDQPVQNFQQLLPFFRNGLLFFTIFSQILLKNITPIHINPLKNSHQIANINKVLDQVRKNQNFGQKFLWSQEQIAQGNEQIILGLIEDLRRFQDNLPPRQQPDYFKEGPYLGIQLYLANKNQNQNQINQNQIQQKNENYNRFNGKQNNQYEQVTPNQDKLKSSIKNFRPSSANFNYNNNNSQNQSQKLTDSNKNILQKSQKINNYVREIQDSADLNKSRKVDNLNETKQQFYNIREQQQSRQNSIQIRQNDKNFLSNNYENQNNSYNFNENNTFQYINKINNNYNNNPFKNQNYTQSQRISNSQLIRNQSFSGHFQNHSSSQQKPNVNENYNVNLNQNFNLNSKQKQRQSMNPFFISQNQHQFSQTNFYQNPQNQQSNNQNFSKNDQISTKKPKNGILKNFSTIKKNNNSFHSQSNSFYEEINENSNLNQLINKITDWLSDHGFAEFALQLDFYQPVIEELQDGIFLSKLIEQLEMKNIDGIIQKPTTKASCIVNIRKIFEILKKHKKMDPQLLSQPEKLFQAHNTYILNLLNNIRKTYESHNTYISKLNSNYGQSFKSLNQTGISNINSTFNNTYLKNKSTQLQSPSKNQNLYYYKNREENYILSPQQRAKILTPGK